MILGFISLILTFTQYYIAEICVPEDVANSMLPCPRNTGIKKKLSRLLEEEEAKPPPKDSKFSCKEVMPLQVDTQLSHAIIYLR